MNRNALFWIRIPLAAVHPFGLLASSARLYQKAVACLRHSPRYITDDPQLICSQSPAYQGAFDLLPLMLYLAPVSVVALGGLCVKFFGKSR